MNLFGLLSAAFITSFFAHTSFLRLSDYGSGSFFVRTSARPVQTALIANPVKSLQAIASLRRGIVAQTKNLRRSPTLKIRPALSIWPSSVVPLAVSLWQRQPQPAVSSTPPQSASARSSFSIVVQRSSRFETRTTEAEYCERSKKQSSKQAIFQVCVNDRLVAEFPSRTQATAMANRLRQWLAAEAVASPLQADELRDRLQPRLVSGLPAGVAGETVLFTIDSRTAKAIRRNSELVAIEWVNQLRMALDAEPLSLVEAQMQLHGLSSTPQGELSGIASWYGPYFHGRLTAAGEIFNQNELTAAHPTLPFNTYLEVTNLETGKSVIVRINDRGPYVGARSLDLSRQAARCIGSESTGVVNYEAVILEPQAVAQERPSPEAIALNRTR